MQPGVSVKLNLEALESSTTQYTFRFVEKYASSIFAGFFYRNGRRHPEYDWIMTTLAQQIDLDGRLAKNIEAHGIEDGFDRTAQDLLEAFESELGDNNSGYKTLNWYFRDYRPSENIEVSRNV